MAAPAAGMSKGRFSMKQGTLITKIIMFILLAGVVLYLGIYAVRSLSDPFTTAMAYQDVLADSVEITGVLVREEQALSSGADIMDVLPDEGERVAAGETVAVLYQSNEALERAKQLQTLEQEYEQLQYALNHGSSLGDAAKLEKQIIDSIQSLRAGTAGGDLSSVENGALDLRAQILQREFTYSASSDSAAALSETLAGLELQISELKSQASYDTTPVRAPCSGLFSRLADGLESVLTPAALETMTADRLLSAADQTESGESVGKLITGDRWYFAAAVEPSTAARLQVGSTITVAFSGDYTGDVEMRVERIGGEESSGCLVVLSSTRHLKDVTLLRTQTADLVFERFTGIRVPKQALHLETRTSTDAQTGAEIETQVLGVYAVVGLRAEFKPVDIVREGSDYYLVTPSADAGKKLLRAGDEIIVTASGLYDGKVVLE